jgi:primase-polymerase (primpol)-like protein
MNTFNAEKVISNAPDELKKSKSWVAYITKPNGKKIDKIPINAITGALAKTNDPNTWTDLDTAINAAIKNNFAGVGYVLQPPYIGIDQDNCITGGKIQSSSLGILKKLKSYSEISPSGKGIHTICKGQLKQSCKLSEFGIEVYTTGRFFTFTGDRMLESPAEIAERTSEIAEVISTYTTEKQLISTAMRIVKKISNSRQAE